MISCQLRGLHQWEVEDEVELIAVPQIGHVIILAHQERPWVGVDHLTELLHQGVQARLIDLVTKELTPHLIERLALLIGLSCLPLLIELHQRETALLVRIVRMLEDCPDRI